MTNTIKLQKHIATSGYCSRRKAEELISQNKVTVNNQPAHLGQRIDPTTDAVKINNVTIEQFDSKNKETTTYLIYKPVDYVSTTSDELGRKTVLNLIPKTKERLYPVGRLDKDSEGLMLLTNDGDLANQLTHPSFEIPKTYHVHLDRKPTYRAIEHLRKGVKLKEGYTKPTQVEQLDDTMLEITITEGRNRQIRRMMERVGYEVTKLIRVRMGEYDLEQLGDKSYKKL